MLRGRSTSGSEVDPQLLVNLGALDSGDSWNDSTRETGSTAIKETKPSRTRETGSTAIKETKPSWNDSTREKAATA